MEGKWASHPSTKSISLTHADSPPCKVLPTGEAPPVAPQRSTSPYTILRSPGPLRIVVSGESAYELSTAQRLANDLFVYHKLDAEIVLETEYLGVTRPGIGNIIVIGSPSGQYIRQCLTKRRTAFSIEVGEDGSPVLQLRGQTLGGSSQGTVT
jgi:hypothetical protein